MITSGEIQRIASRQSLRDTQIEKDYIIGWILFGISKNEKLKSLLAFKGGTAIKKFYVKYFRLSEDLDFTFIKGKMDVDILKQEFIDVIEWVKDESRIILEFRNEKRHKTGNYNFYIGYAGPLGGSIGNKDIKVDVCDCEKICNKTQMRFALNDYSDLTEAYEMDCYSIGDIISEKLRSLMQRTMPRDLYDLWFFFEKDNKDILDYVSDFQAKTIFKVLDPNKFIETVMLKKGKYKSSWENNLSSQVREIPDFESIWRELSRHFKLLDKHLNH